jgi:hypothetical protein|tara:strand:+ start:189 stop:1895 length:1707 start_codon:yes stop_codon:yes gene_type:complete
MAKQTTTGGAYSNYQVIKTGDTTGSSEALAKGMANIASTVAQNSKDLYAARKEQLAKVEQNKRDLRAKGQIRTTKAQEMLLNADTAIKSASISDKLKEGFTTGFQSLTNRWGKAGAVLDNNDSTDEEKKQANADIFNARKSINSLNLALKKSQEMQVNAIENLANTQSLGPTWSYNSIDVAETDFDTFKGDLKPGDPNYDITKPFNGAVPKNKMVSDNGSTMEGWNAAHANSAGTTMYLKEKDGQFFLGGSGSLMVEGKEESWKYETDINSYNNPSYSTTTKYTPLIPEASQQVVDQMYGKDPKGKSTGKIDSSLIMKDDKGVEVTFLNPDDGIQYTEIRKDTFGANIIQAADVALSKFDAINNIQDKNNILQSMLRITKEDGEKLWNPNPEIAKPAREELQTAIVDKTKGEALASLNLKEIGDKLYKVSDVQPKKPTVTKATVKEKDRRSTLNTISKTFDEYGNFDNAKDFGEGLTTALMLDNDFTVNKDGNIMKQSNKLDEIAMDKLPADSKEEIFESETWIINGPDPISNRKNLINLLLSKHSNLSSSQADDLAKKLLKKKPAQK